MTSTVAYPGALPSPHPVLRKPLNLPALFSLIAAVLVLSPVAIVLGHVGVGRARRETQRGTVLAVIGLVVGYLGLMAMIAGLVWLVFYVTAGPTPVTSW